MRLSSAPLPVNLCVFDTSKGHFGRTDIYRRTIEDLSAQIDLERFAALFVHIKVGPGEEAVYVEQEKFYLALGFTVIRSDAAWSHHSVSHQNEYARDLIRVYGDFAVQRAPYCLHLESDWLFRSHSCWDLQDAIEKSMGYLATNHTVVSVRFARFQNEMERLNGLRAKHGMDVVAKRESFPWDSFIRHNDNLSLNPNLFRTRDIYAATRLLKTHFAQLGQHVEMGFTHAFHHLADGCLPFAILDPALFSVYHIGTPAGQEDDVSKNVLAN